MKMKTAVLSDIHANAQALTAVLKDCEKQGVERVWMLGDYVDYGADPGQVMELIANTGAEHMIAGNHDGCQYLHKVRPSATEHGKLAYEYTKEIIEKNRVQFRLLEKISRVPEKYIKQKKILLIHGTPEDPYWGKFRPDENSQHLFQYMEKSNIELMLMGHSHIGFLIRQNGRMILNPGSVGQPRDGCPKASYAILDDDSVIFRRISYDIDGAADAIKRAGLPEYLWKRLYIGR